MEDLVKNNIHTIFGILILVIFSVYIIVKIHEWLFKIAISGLILISAVVIYFQYSGINLVDWHDLKDKGLSFLGVGTEQLNRQKTRIAQKIGRKVGNQMESLSRDLMDSSQLQKLTDPLRRIKKKVGEKILQIPFDNNQTPLKSLQKRSTQRKDKVTQNNNHPSTNFSLSKKGSGLLEF